jgi:hypothetical protein
MDENEILYGLEITNGYVFRRIFELYVKLVIQSVQMFFSKDVLTIRTASGVKNGRKIISSVEINPDDIIKYYFNQKLAHLPETDETPAIIVEQFDITDIGNNFKSIPKTSGIYIYKEKDKDTASFKILGLTTDNFWIKCAKYEPVEYDLSGFKDILLTPNIKIDIKQFCNQLKNMNKGGPECFVFNVFKQGLEIESRNISNVVLRKGSFGNVQGDDYFSTKVNTSVVEALCKINSMVIYSIVKIYSCKNGYLKISHKIADFGQHSIYLTEEC